MVADYAQILIYMGQSVDLSVKSDMSFMEMQKEYVSSMVIGLAKKRIVP